MTAAELITSALRLGGALGQGELPNEEELADAFDVLNMLIGGWSAEGIVYTMTVSDHSLGAGKSIYKMGPSAGAGEWITPARPLLIRAASARTTAGLSGPVEVADAQKWAGIPDNSETAQLIRMLHCDYAYPDANVQVWPVPAAAGATVTLHAFYPLAEISEAGSQIALPPGYLKALRYNLARDLAAEYGRALDPTVAQIAAETKAALVALSAQVLGGAAPPAPAAPAAA